MTLAYEHAALGTDPPAAIDVERLVQWALAPGRAGGIPWRDQPGLAFDRGCTAKPRRAPRGSWALVVAGAVHTPTRRVVIEAIPDEDAAIVLAAIRALSGPAAALVIHHGRNRTRPGWTEIVESHAPRLTATGRPWIDYGDARRRGQPYCPLVITREAVVTDQAICRYRAWWGGLLLVAEFTRGRLRRWDVSGLAAPEHPWEDPP